MAFHVSSGSDCLLSYLRLRLREDRRLAGEERTGMLPAQPEGRAARVRLSRAGEELKISGDFSPLANTAAAFQG